MMYSTRYRPLVCIQYTLYKLMFFFFSLKFEESKIKLHTTELHVCQNKVCIRFS